jgi:hypothetical protein
MARFSLLTKLLLAILTPTVLTFAGFAVLGHYAAARALEAELGRRLAGIAAVTATQISEESVALLAPGDEESRTYRNLRRRLVEARDAAGVARVYLFAADLTALVDTDEVPIGTRYYGLETSRAELRQVFPSELEQAPRPASSLRSLALRREPRVRGGGASRCVLPSASMAARRFTPIYWGCARRFCGSAPAACWRWCCWRCCSGWG